MAEVSTLTYACRASVDRTAVTISNLTPEVPFATLPAGSGVELSQVVGDLYPAITPKVSVLETGLANINAIEHPAQALLNTGWIEHTRGDFYFYKDGTTPGVGRAIDAVDLERLRLAAALGVEARPFVEIFHAAGYTTRAAADTGSAYTALQHSEPNFTFRSPPSLDHRYIHEDVGFGLVPWALWARIAGVETPAIDSLITIASLINSTSYLTKGLTLERMGLHGATLTDLGRLLATGGAEAADQMLGDRSVSDQ